MEYWFRVLERSTSGLIAMSSSPICSSASNEALLVDDGGPELVCESVFSVFERRNMDERTLPDFEDECIDFAGFTGLEHMKPRSRGVKS
jgi:hypothetical protein